MIFLKNNLYFTTFVLIFLKTIFFISLISSSGANKIDPYHLFYGPMPIFIYLSFILIYLSITFLFKNNKKKLCLILLNLFFSIFIIFDLWNYRAFGTFLTLYVLDQSANLENLSGSIISMIKWVDLIFLMDIPFLIIFFSKFHILIKEKRKRIQLFFITNIIAISFISIYHYKVDILDKGENRILFRICWSPNQTIYNLSPLGFRFYDAFNFISERKKLVLSSFEKKEISLWFENNQEKELSTKYSSIFKGKNLLILQVESLETFVINQKIDGQEITPTLNSLKNNSLYFPNYYEQINIGTSSDGDLMTNTSMYPIRVGSTFFRFPDNKYFSLPKHLESMGYETNAIHPDKGAYWNWMPGLRGIGFRNLYDTSSFKLDELIGLGLSDGSFLKQTIPIIKNSKKPFYTFMVTLTSHSPFDLPSKYRGLKLTKDLDENKMGGYFQSVNYTDRQIGIFLKELDDIGLLKDTVVVIYGDHTGIHKFYKDEVDSLPQKEPWWDNNKKIPLLIYSKDLVGEKIETIGGQVDLMPTLLYMFGVEGSKYKNSVMGKNILNSKEGYALLTDGKIVGDLDENKKSSVLKSFEISDKIIRSNYFNEK